jgi:hypothetical protein
MQDQRHYAGGTLRIAVWVFLFAVIVQIARPPAKAQETLEPIKVATEVHSSFDSGGGYLGGGICRGGTRTIIDETPLHWRNSTLLGYVLDYESGSLTRRWCESRRGVHSLVYFEVYTFLRDRPRDRPRRFTRVMLTFESHDAPDTTRDGRGADRFPIRSVQASTASWLPGFRSLDARTVRVNARSIGHDNLDFPIRRQLSFDVTNTVREWMDGRQVNHGFLITARLPRGEDLNATNLRRLVNFRLEFFF